MAPKSIGGIVPETSKFPSYKLYESSDALRNAASNSRRTLSILTPAVISPANAASNAISPPPFTIIPSPIVPPTSSPIFTLPLIISCIGKLILFFVLSNPRRFADVLALSTTMPNPTYGVISYANADGANINAAINNAIFVVFIVYSFCYFGC